MTVIRNLCAIGSLPHSCEDAWGGDIIAAACTHLASTVESRRFEGAWIAQEYIDGHYDNANSVVIDSGHIAVPQGAGLGVKPETGMVGQPVAAYGS